MKRILILGASPSVLQSVMDEVSALGVHVEGSTNTDNATTEFNAKKFDLIVFGSGIVGPISKRLRNEFKPQNPEVKFLDAFAPVALKQIKIALGLETPKQQYVKNFSVIDQRDNYLLKADILEPCTVRIEIYKTKEQGAEKTHIILLEETTVEPGPFEYRINGKHRTHDHMIYTTFNDEFRLYNMHDEMASPFS